MATSVRILTVCTHNRTRSVMMAAFLQSMLEERLGPGATVVHSSGFGPVGLPPIGDAVTALRRRRLDVSGHRSQATTALLVDAADVILTAERDHVVRVAALSPDAFRRAMTLPEFLGHRGDLPFDGAASVRRWLEDLNAGRTAGAYLRDTIAEVADPTGTAPRVFETAVAALEQQCNQASDLLARVVRVAAEG